MFTLEITSDVTSLFSDAERWDGLARGIPFRQTAWLAPWWKHFGREAEAYVVTARDADGNLRGLLPLYRNHHRSSGRVLSAMGDGEACSDYTSVLAAEADLPEIARQMGQYLTSIAACPRLGWDLLDLDGVVEGDAGMIALSQGLQAGGSTLHATSRMNVWYKPVDASWEDHLKHYSKTHRRKMRRWSEKIGEAAPFQQRIAESREEVSSMLNSLITLHQDRWNQLGEPGSFASPRFRDFVHEAAQGFLDRGQLFLTTLEHEGQAIAAELNVIGGNRILYSYSSGFDISQADLEPGRVLSAGILQQLYRRSFAGMDYLRGDEEYKKRHATVSRRLIRLRAVAPTLFPRLRHAAWNTGFEVKQWLRRQTGRDPVLVLDPVLVPNPVVNIS